MRGWLLLAAALLVAPTFAGPGGAFGAEREFRILTHGDLVAAPIALAVGCREGSRTAPVQCDVVRDEVGYDGVTGGHWLTEGHAGHAFTCTATSEATPGLESISVGFDVDGDTFTDDNAHYPDTRYRPLAESGLAPDGVPVPETGVDLVDSTLGLPTTVNPSVRDGFLVSAAFRGRLWPSVSGEVLGDAAFVFNHLGEDVRVVCLY